MYISEPMKNEQCNLNDQTGEVTDKLYTPQCERLISFN